jgi:benzoate membrane transport protein
MLKKWLSDASLSTVVAGFVAVLVGFTSSAAIVFSAAQALGANEAQTASWMWALGLGMGGTSLVLSLWYRQPVLTAWSTPGAAVPPFPRRWCWPLPDWPWSAPLRRVCPLP